MQNPRQESAISGPVNLLKHYSFESNNRSYEAVLNSWLGRFPLDWVHLALIESLHQGRYKVVSVEQILSLWQRRGKPSYHFSHDFERLVSNNLPQPFKKKARSNTRALSRRSTDFWKVSASNFSTPNRSGPNKSKSLSSTDQQDQPSTVLSSSPSLPVPSSPGETLLAQIISEPSSLSEAESSSYSELETHLSQINVADVDTIEDESSQLPEPLPLDLDQDSAALIVSSEEDQREDSSPDSVPFSQTTVDSVSPVHQFVPQSTKSLFHSKLTAMAQINV